MAPAGVLPVFESERDLPAAAANLLGSQHLAMGAIAANFGTRQNDLKTEMALNLLAHFWQQVAEKLLDSAAPQADDVRVFLLETRFVVVLIAVVMHQVQLVHQAAGLEQLERAVDGDAVDFGIFFARQLKQALGIQVLAGLVDQVQQNLALPRQPDALLLERIFDPGCHHIRNPIAG